VDDVRGPLNVDAHTHDTNMLVDNDVIENVVATVIVGVLEDIYTPIRKRASVALLSPSPVVQSLYTEGTQDSLSFSVFSIANDVHAPLEPTSQIQDPPDLIEII
jgi:subtilisin-like proprotein convertase family protein